MHTPVLESTRWRRSTFSGGGENCIEVAYAGVVRDSKNTGPTLVVDLPALIRAVRRWH